MNNIQKTILITGGCGHIGTNLATLALKKGYNVISFDNLHRAGVETNILKHENYQMVRGDIRNPEDFNFIPNRDKITAIYNFAANSGVPWSFKNPEFDYNVNARGVFNVLEFSRKNGKIPVIQSSTNKIYSEDINEIPLIEKRTRYVYNDNKFKNGISESFPMDSVGKSGHSPYGNSKASADLMCQEWYHAFNIPTVVIRMSCIYGKYQFGVTDQGWMAWFVIAKVLGLPLTIYGDGKQVRDALYAEDVARLYLMALENIDKFKGKVFNIGGGMKNTVSLIEAIELIDLIDNGRHPEFKIKYEDWREADHRCYISDIDKITSCSDWSPTINVGLGLRKTYDWVVNNKELLKRYIKY